MLQKKPPVQSCTWQTADLWLRSAPCLLCLLKVKGRLVKSAVRVGMIFAWKAVHSSYLLADEHMVDGYGEWMRHPLFGLRTRCFDGVYKQRRRRGRRVVWRTTFSRPLWQIERKASSFGDQRGVSPPILTPNARQKHCTPFRCMCTITSIPLWRF